MTYTPSLSADRPRHGSAVPGLATPSAWPRPCAGRRQHCSAPLSNAASEQLQIRSSPRGDCTLVQLVGELDLLTFDLTHATLHALLAQQKGSRLVLDLGKLTFTDARGTSALLSAGRSAAEKGGWVRLACVSNHVRRVLEIVHLTKSLPVYDTVAAAIAAPGTRRTRCGRDEWPLSGLPEAACGNIASRGGMARPPVGSSSARSSLCHAITTSSRSLRNTGSSSAEARESS